VGHRKIGNLRGTLIPDTGATPTKLRESPKKYDRLIDQFSVRCPIEPSLNAFVGYAVLAAGRKPRRVRFPTTFLQVATCCFVPLSTYFRIVDMRFYVRLYGGTNSPVKQWGAASYWRTSAEVNLAGRARP
jgi:hypothetical protein